MTVLGASYSGDPSNSNNDAVRFLIGDTDVSNALMSDSEIAYLLSQNGGATQAAIAACEQLATRFAQQVDKKIGQVSVSASQRSKRYAEMANELRKTLYKSCDIYVGGQSITDKIAIDNDTDAVQPVFRIGADNHPDLPRNDQVDDPLVTYGS